MNNYDGFGIAHRDTCRAPNWMTITDPEHRGHTAHRCRSCGITWRKADGQLTPRHATYGGKR